METWIHQGGLSSGSIADSETAAPWAAGLAAWTVPAGVGNERGGVVLAEMALAGTWEVQPTLRVAREQLGSGPGPWATKVSSPRLLAAQR